MIVITGISNKVYEIWGALFAVYSLFPIPYSTNHKER